MYWTRLQLVKVSNVPEARFKTWRHQDRVPFFTPDDAAYEFTRGERRWERYDLADAAAVEAMNLLTLHNGLSAEAASTQIGQIWSDSSQRLGGHRAWVAEAERRDLYHAQVYAHLYEADGPIQPAQTPGGEPVEISRVGRVLGSLAEVYLLAMDHADPNPIARIDLVSLSVAVRTVRERAARYGLEIPPMKDQAHDDQH